MDEQPQPQAPQREPTPPPQPPTPAQPKLLTPLNIGIFVVVFGTCFAVGILASPYLSKWVVSGKAVLEVPQVVDNTVSTNNGFSFLLPASWTAHISSVYGTASNATTSNVQRIEIYNTSGQNVALVECRAAGTFESFQTIEVFRSTRTMVKNGEEYALFYTEFGGDIDSSAPNKLGVYMSVKPSAWESTDYNNPEALYKSCRLVGRGLNPYQLTEYDMIGLRSIYTSWTSTIAATTTQISDDLPDEGEVLTDAQGNVSAYKIFQSDVGYFEKEYYPTPGSFYSSGRSVLGADLATFKVVCSGDANLIGYAKDAQQVYYRWTTIQDADPMTYQSLYRTQTDMDIGLCSEYAIDKAHAYYTDKKISDSPDTFVLVFNQSTYDAQDKNHKYLRGNIVE